MLSAAARRYRPGAGGLFSSGIYRHSSTARTFKVVLDGDTLYVDQPLAEALGWRRETSTSGLALTLSGWEPKYFAITPKGSEAELLAQATVESSRNPRVQAILQALAEADASDAPST